MDPQITPSRFSGALWMGALLVASGLVHLALVFATGGEWSGPVSLRKPALFGISAGVTVWSLVWVLTRLVPHRFDQRFATIMSSSLLVEVGLITLQYWRGVPSHFNRTTAIDAAVEFTMLGLIFFVTLGIAWLCWRSRRVLPMPEAEALALCGGLWLLLVSCLLGFVITGAGEFQLARGQSPEVWGQAGVLKYPHGAALHAIQTLPLLAALLHRLRIDYSAHVLRMTIAAQVAFLAHALWQTLGGRARWDVDFTGGLALGIAGLLLLPLLVAMVRFAGRSWGVLRDRAATP